VHILPACCFLISLASLQISASGALGLEFSQEIDTQAIGVQLENTDEQYLPYPPENVTYAYQKSAPQHLMDQWFTLIPNTLPRILQDRAVNYQVQINEHLHPMRIVARVQLKDTCSALFQPLHNILARKYVYQEGTSPREGFVRKSHFNAEGLQVELLCTNDENFILLEYSDITALSAWSEFQSNEIISWEIEQQHLRNRDLSNSVSIGERYRLRGGFSLPFDSPVKKIGSFEVDQALELNGDRMSTDMLADRYVVFLSPEAKPYKISGFFHFDSQIDAVKKMKQLFAAFTEVYGTALKDRPRHKIFNVSSDFIVQKLLRPATVELTFIHQDGVRKQRQREREAIARAEIVETERLKMAQINAEMEAQAAKDREDEERRRWEEATIGL